MSFTPPNSPEGPYGSGAEGQQWPQQPPPGPPPVESFGQPAGQPPQTYGQNPYPPYGQPQYPNYPQYAWQPPNPTTNGMAIASLVLGILWLYWIGSVLAIIFGYMARRQIGESGGREQGGGLATAGIVLGWIGVGILVFIFLAVVVGSGLLAGSA